MRSEWISVNNKLPDDDTIVIVYVPGSGEPVWLAYFSGEDASWRFVEGGTCYPTHWMELPAPPDHT